MNGRFTQLFGAWTPRHFDEADLRRLAGEMTAKQERRPTRETERDPEEDPEITAAYTYLGQFVDHDLTFDPTSQLREFLSRTRSHGLADFRTPRFDLDNLYGRGPADQPYMYAGTGSACCWASACRATPTTRIRARYPAGRAAGRSSAIRATTRTASWRSFTPSSCGSTTGSPSTWAQQASFEEVRQQVRWHYQWMLVTDFLPTVVNNETFTSVFADPRNRRSQAARAPERASCSCPWSFPWRPSASGTPWSAPCTGSIPRSSAAHLLQGQP